MATCRVCKAPTTLRFGLTPACSIDHAIQHANAQKAKREKARQRAERARHREAKLRLKSRAEWMRDAQRAFNAFIRERDHRLPCVSCGRFHQGQWHAGHYRSVGAAPELRFEPLNVHKQCAPCNNHKSGNVIEYRINLVARIGADRVEWLEGPHAPKKYTIDELKEIKRFYSAEVRRLRKQRGTA